MKIDLSDLNDIYMSIQARKVPNVVYPARLLKAEVQYSKLGEPDVIGGMTPIHVIPPICWDLRLALPDHAPQGHGAIIFLISFLVVHPETRLPTRGFRA